MNARERIKQAREILGGKIVPAIETYELAEELREEGVYSYARKLFAQLRKSQAAEVELVNALRNTSVNVKLALKQSSCTYEDPDLPVDSRFKAALDILEEAENIQQSANSEALSLAGDIYTRKWETDGQKNNLERAYFYYYQAYRLGGIDSLASSAPIGSAAINAAFLLDRLAQLELEQAEQVNPKGESVETVWGRRKEAWRIRRELVEHFTPIADQIETQAAASKRWRLLVALAEAHFGLGEYDRAAAWLTQAAGLPDIPDRKYEAIARRLTALYRLRIGSASFADFEKSEAGEVLAKFLSYRIKTSTAAIESLFAGKVGLALSGNGFRACFFHVGVLAKLAELGILRKVEVLSCTSGGSIVGTKYYLELRRLLQSKPDQEIQDKDYIDVVKLVERGLLAGVQRDLQARSRTNPWVNLKALFKKNYSPTEHIGELFAKEIFCSETAEDKPVPRYLRDLHVQPQGEVDSFRPKKDNWRRAAKVPILVLNATTLNTGHNWQFTASWMGEPAGPINSEIDGNLRLRQVRFEEAPDSYRDFSIGRAVAASACVPALLEPIALDRLYPGITVRLIDGSVSEPLAITPLIDQGCTFLLVSDASGNTDTQTTPGIASVEVAARSDRISTSHLREAQYNLLAVRHQSSVQQELMFVHLKKDLESGMLDQIEHSSGSANESTKDDRSAPLTSYGIRKEVQELLAKIRSELDTFSDTEAYALMTSGYLITDSEFDKSVVGLSRPQIDRPDWRFLAIEEEMKKVGDSDLLKLLAVAQNRILRVWRLSSIAQGITSLVIPAAFLGVIAMADKLSDWKKSGAASDLFDTILVYLFFTIVLVVVLLLFLLPISLAVLAILKLIRRDKTVGQIIRGLGTLLFGWLGSWIQLFVFDRWYLALGNIKDRAPADSEDASKWTRAGTALRDTFDKASKVSGESITKALTRFDTVDAVSKLFEANGYEVTRFPRDKEINPFQLNLDLFARKEDRRIFADIKMGPSAVNWKDASGLKIAASLLRGQGEQARSEQQDVDAMLILIDVPLDESLKKFSEKEGVKLVRMDGDDLKRIVENKGDTEKLRMEAEKLDLFTEALASPVAPLGA